MGGWIATKALPFIVGTWDKLAAIGVIVGAIFVGLAKVKKAGKDEARAETAAATLVTERRMRDANAAGPRSASDVDDRLRDGRF